MVSTAYRDIDLIAEYIAQDSIDRAALFVIKLMNYTEKLETYPRTGRMIPEINDESCRELFFGSYRIMYRILENDDINITGVVHGARNWKPNLK